MGGEPFEPENQAIVVKVLRRIREVYPSIDIWAYTGYLYDSDLQEGGEVHTELTDEILGYIDTLVDGRFVEGKKNLSLAFRGSSNQRILDLNYIRNLKERGDIDGYNRYFRFFSDRD